MIVDHRSLPVWASLRKVSCHHGKLKSDLAAVAYDFHSNLDQLLPYLRRLKAFRVGHIYLKDSAIRVLGES